MPKFRAIARKVIDAEQFVDAARPPRGVYVSGSQAFVKTMQGVEVPVSVGEWIVKEANAPGYYPIDDAEFQRTYEPAPQD
jgi:hypothetical protein